jgi:hypothetical protein
MMSAHPRNTKPPAGGQTGAGANIKTGSLSISPVDLILSLLSKHRQSGPGRWLGCCPGPLHRRGDRNMSLSIGETAEGAALIHCFAGCEPGAILGALSLTLADLYPPRLKEPDYHGGRPKAPPIPWRDVFTALETDLTACSLAFMDLSAGKPFSPADAAYIATRAADLAAIVREVRHGR